ncbi:unnamed protein product [Rotaria sordida]|uniref:Uncharacterized protein n=1 Tax=Rotaria sordida TaxID=392033 RepID=A0A814ZTM5_9BILA|nr:unnamed protein product [Rotaria sordida]
MMLNKRAAEIYLFLTWYISAPLLTLIITVTKLISAAPITLGAGGGFPHQLRKGISIFAQDTVEIPINDRKQ